MLVFSIDIMLLLIKKKKKKKKKKIPLECQLFFRIFGSNDFVSSEGNYL